MKRILKRVFSLILVSSLISACANKTDIDISLTGDNSTDGIQIDGEAGKMRDISSAELVKEMGLGWNLGDTLDVCNADRNGDGEIDENSAEVDETLWRNPKTTKELFEALKADGITSVRIPITWRDHLDENNKIDTEWMDRVQEVVDYAYNSGIYVINIHHDGGGDPDFGAWVRSTSSDYEAFYAKYSAIWSQIAERFKDYSDFLVFESMNEVGFDDLSKDEAYTLLNKINQAFVDLIRASDGNNKKRHLLIAGYWTDIASCCDERLLCRVMRKTDAYCLYIIIRLGIFVHTILRTNGVQPQRSKPWKTCLEV